MVQKVKVSRKQEMVLQFTGRAHCHLQKSLELAVPASTATLSNVCSNRGTSTPDLGNNSKDFMLGKISCQGVAVQSKFMCFFPDFQIAEVLHVHFPGVRIIFAPLLWRISSLQQPLADTKCRRL